ncbi:alpha/beta hydrolase fold domain-containing protein [Aldersonia kunmingensis]|uniref:alpha/beta hydrolase fold domain-containing protein n=1 Tax=Aldersonia kunmingensis TaxID=408066 RepID=UPI0009FBEDF8|nr:alpha/beta hydrolase [Aldersonia kunmingensis]
MGPMQPGFVRHVGALAVSLGMGALVATGSGVASADPATVVQQPKWDSAFTGDPSIVTQALVEGLRAATSVTEMLGFDAFTTFARLASSTSPPPFLTLGLDVQRSDFAGMQVLTLRPANPSGKQVVALHGGAFSIEATAIHWVDYVWLAHATGATVSVPIYPLAPTNGGTADSVIPKLADLVSGQIAAHGVRNVSVYGDSAGGTLGLAIGQELVRRAEPVPSSMVLLSPVLDLSFSNPNIGSVKDPVLNREAVGADLPSWAGGLSLTDPMVSPLYGSLEGLPPTWIYSGSLEMLAPDAARLQQRAHAEGADNLHFVLRKGLIHDWALPVSPEGFFVRDDVYRQLGLIGS